MNAWVTGVGLSRFSRQPHRTLAELAWEAVERAVVDDYGSVTPAALCFDAVFVGNVFGEPGVASRALNGMGISGMPVLTLESACASGTVAFHEAAVAVGHGRYRRVLVLGMEQMSTFITGPIVPQQTDAEGRMGLAMPAMYGLSAHAWLSQGRVTRQQLAAVAVKNRRHAEHNYLAHTRRQYTLDEVLASPMISDPLTRLQCSPVTDGAAAVIVTSVAPDIDAVRVRGTHHASGRAWDTESTNIWGFDVVRSTSEALYAEAGLNPKDVHVAEVHDAFTIGELSTTEALQLIPDEMAGVAVATGRTTYGGEVVVNPSGGLLARGHPLGATGVAQVAEIVTQLRHRAGPRQVPSARLGLVETMGGGVSGLDGNACVVVALERDGS